MYHLPYTKNWTTLLCNTVYLSCYSYLAVYFIFFSFLYILSLFVMHIFFPLYKQFVVVNHTVWMTFTFFCTMCNDQRIIF